MLNTGAQCNIFNFTDILSLFCRQPYVLALPFLILLRRAWIGTRRPEAFDVAPERNGDSVIPAAYTMPECRTGRYLPATP